MTKREFKKVIEKELRDNADVRGATIKIHRPWVYVEFDTHYDNGRFHKDIVAWGVAKICWPDKWSTEKGAALATNRAFAWAAKEILKELS